MIKTFENFIYESAGSVREFRIVEPDDDYPFKMVSNSLYKTYDYETMKFVERRIVIGVVPVIFSYRIKAGYEGIREYKLDYCSGADPTMVNYLFNIVLNILRYKSGDPFKEWPFQDIKPYFNDKKNFPKLLKMLPKNDLVTIDIPELSEIRKIYYDRNNINLKL